jgi:hypothetical protein
MVVALDADPREQWTAIADEMIAGRKADPEATQEEIGDRMGQSQDWVGAVLAWRTKLYDARRTPFARGDWDHRKQQIATQTPVKQADRVKMAEKLLEDPKVVKAVLAKPTIAARGVKNAVIEKETAAKRQAAEQAKEAAEQRKESLPTISGRASAIITKIDQWAFELDKIREDLHELEGRSAELVDMAHANLIRATEANREELGHPSTLHVIEGTAVKTRQPEALVAG